MVFGRRYPEWIRSIFAFIFLVLSFGFIFYLLVFMFWFLFFWLGVCVRATRSNASTKPKKESIREYEWSALSSVAVATDTCLLRLSSPLPVAKQVEGEFEGAIPTQLVQRMHTSAFDLLKKIAEFYPFQ